MSITAQQALNRLIEQNELFRDEMLDLMRQIMSGALSPVQTAAILMGLRVKGETIGEITAAAQVMRELATRVDVADRTHLVDTCGTGGDGMHTFNISTTAAFVAAAAGAKVAKHMGRSVSSSTGSADVLEKLGIQILLTPEQVAQSIAQVGIGFMFAPSYHGAMKHAAPVRKELGVRTIFNILGPLVNPAGAHNQVMGVFHPDLVGIQARVLKELGSRHVMVVHGRDGLDEITLGDATMVAELKDGVVREYDVTPEEFGLSRASMESVRVTDAEQSRDMLLGVLKAQPGPARDIVVLNAAAAIYVSGVASSMPAAITQALATINSGAALRKLDALREMTTSFPANV